MLCIFTMILGIMAYIFSGKIIFAWLTIMAGLVGVILCWVILKQEEKEHIDDLVQKCIEDLKNGGDY